MAARPPLEIGWFGVIKEVLEFGASICALQSGAEGVLEA